MKKPHQYRLSQCYSYSIIIYEFFDIENVSLTCYHRSLIDRVFGAVMMVTGCGNKPGSDSVTLAKGTVWESQDGRYSYFHSDGHLYFAEPDAGILKKHDMDTYSIN